MAKPTKRGKEVNAAAFGAAIVPSTRASKTINEEVPHAELVSAELIPSPAAQGETSVKLSQIQALVQQQVAEVLSKKDDFVLEPWFRTRQVAYELRRLQTVPERKAWNLVYRWGGCIVCKTAELPHAGNGMCPRCRARIHQLKRSAEREIMAKAEGRGL